MRQVLENLLSNALKYGEGNSISVYVLSEPGQVNLIVKDQGPGIPPDFAPKIFNVRSTLGNGTAFTVRLPISQLF